MLVCCWRGPSKAAKTREKSGTMMEDHQLASIAPQIHWMLLYKVTFFSTLYGRDSGGIKGSEEVRLLTRRSESMAQGSSLPVYGLSREKGADRLGFRCKWLELGEMTLVEAR